MKMVCETRHGYNKLMDLWSYAQTCPSVIVRVLRDLLLPKLTSQVTQKLIPPQVHISLPFGDLHCTLGKSSLEPAFLSYREKTDFRSFPCRQPVWHSLWMLLLGRWRVSKGKEQQRARPGAFPFMEESGPVWTCPEACAVGRVELPGSTAWITRVRDQMDAQRQPGNISKRLFNHQPLLQRFHTYRGRNQYKILKKSTCHSQGWGDYLRQVDIGAIHG